MVKDVKGGVVGYGKVTCEVLRRLEEVLGSENVCTGGDELSKYSRDENPLGLAAFPEAVVKPVNTEQVAETLSLANEVRIPVTFRGQGTGLCGAAVPAYGGIVMSFERMNDIIEVDEGNLMAVAEPGVALLNLKQEVEKLGLFYPGDPGERTSTIGGNVATNAGGMNGVKYGKTRAWVLGLEAVLPGGKVLNLGGKVVKRSMGYDLMHLVIGSEGTLAAVTKVVVRLIKLPKVFITLYIPFHSLQNAVRSVSEVLRRRITPTAMEFVEKEVILEAEKQLGKTMPHHDAEAYLIIRVDGDEDQEIRGNAEAISGICLENHALNVIVADTKESQSGIWDVRSAFYDVIVRNRVAQIVDSAIPPSRIAEYMQNVKEISGRHGVRVLGYGHAGDGNIHLHPLKDDLSDVEWRRRFPKVMEELYTAAAAMGGTISGEHGIGLAKKKYLQLGLEEEQIRLMKEVKRLFDPGCILNPGKIFDIE